MKYKSISTDIYHNKLSQYLAEVMMVNNAPGLRQKTYFWRNNKHKSSYMGLIINLEKRLKNISGDLVKAILEDGKITKLDELDEEIIRRIKNEN